MKTLKLIALLFLSIIVGCKGEKKETLNSASTEENNIKTLAFAMESKNGSNVSGKITFTEIEGMVNMEAKITGLNEGEHAIHIHEKADCSSSDGKSTGGHWNPTLEPHGKWGAKEGYHRGDIGNFKTDANGTGVINFATNEWCLGCDDDKKNIIGKAIIVHQGMDDFTSQPSGAAGSRVSCGAIIQ